MKKIFLLFIFAFGFSQAQMPNISKVWLNDNLPYNGGFGNDDGDVILTRRGRRVYPGGFFPGSFGGGFGGGSSGGGFGGFGGGGSFGGDGASGGWLNIKI